MVENPPSTPTGKGTTMRTIYKYPIPFGDEATVMMPKGALLLTFAIQGIYVTGLPNICVWALVDTEAEMEAKKFKIFGTGYPLPDDCVKYGGDLDYDFEYETTVFDHKHVWHIFLGCDNRLE